MKRRNEVKAYVLNNGKKIQEHIEHINDKYCNRLFFTLDKWDLPYNGISTQEAFNLIVEKDGVLINTKEVMS